MMAHRNAAARSLALLQSPTLHRSSLFHTAHQQAKGTSSAHGGCRKLLAISNSPDFACGISSRQKPASDCAAGPFQCNIEDFVDIISCLQLSAMPLQQTQAKDIAADLHGIL